jgi:DNA-binding transcriptional LysR family regulator
VGELTEWPLLHDTDAYLPQRWMSWHSWFERAGVDPKAASRGYRFSDSIILVQAAIAGLGIAIARAPHIDAQLSRGQLLRLTRESWTADWMYRLVGPTDNFTRPNVRAFTEWVLAEAQAMDSR